MLSQSPQHHQTNLFGSDLLMQLDPNDPLLQLASVIPRQDFEEAFSKYYTKNVGAPSKPIRLMVGLLLLKSLSYLMLVINTGTIGKVELNDYGLLVHSR